MQMRSFVICACFIQIQKSAIQLKEKVNFMWNKLAIEFEMICNKIYLRPLLINFLVVLIDWIVSMSTIKKNIYLKGSVGSNPPYPHVVRHWLLKIRRGNPGSPQPRISGLKLDIQTGAVESAVFNRSVARMVLK